MLLLGLAANVAGAAQPANGDACQNGDLRQLSMQYTGASCAATSHTQDAVQVRCFGDPMLTARVLIVVSDKRDAWDRSARFWFLGEVALNGYFYPDAANAGQERLAGDTFVHVFDGHGVLLQSVMFDTSCSQPLFAGDQFGSVRLIGHLSVNDPAAATKFCVGETTNCPCQNVVWGAGCRNGRGLGGAFDSLGSESVFTDDLQLVASGLPRNAPGRTFMGSAGGPAVFLDNGTRCVVGPGTVFRFPTRFADANGVFTEGPGIVAWSGAHFGPGGAIGAGSTKHFQVWYRDAFGPCGATSNLTNAVAVTFAP